ncbi:protein HflC [Pseudooceanicola nanhaiensis]|jgi:membrane protease subunit HflC|uniref:Protein HflC n=1 Tax=Pseudooceanicola nanhaiensis TaxID=375761 RepID=A0A917SL13_9RHOB|nr:protease modulator HflC [Pseudooceanicola nanhaiensis]GGL86094.1 protein HflC [Pseudooceanicola nanhaiensis]
MRKGTALIIVLVAAFLLFVSSIFIVDEREKALVLQFGRVVSVKEDPGLAFKIPLVQEVVRYDDRILSRDTDPLEVTPLDDRRLVVDAFARYRITDVKQFRQAVGVGGITAAESRLDSILRSQIREVLGSVSSNDILSSDRAALMQRIRNGAVTEARNLGLEIIDVRLKRTDLPRENLDATFARMRAEREREAADEIARGNEAAQRIRAQADRTQVEIVSDANRQAEIVRGQADARRNSVYANAYGADSEFFEFYRSLSAYERALKGENSTMVISPNGEFFNYLRSSNPEIAAEVAATGSADVPQSGAGEGQGDQGAAAVAEESSDAATQAPGSEAETSAEESTPADEGAGVGPATDEAAADDTAPAGEDTPAAATAAEEETTAPAASE